MVTKLTYKEVFKMKRILFFVMILGLLGTACAQKKVVAPEAVGPETMKQGVEERKAVETTKPAEKIREEQIAKVESKDITSKVEEVSGLFNDIYFDFDKYEIREDAKPVLKALADYLIKNNNHKVLIEGHCDERGTNEYNLALGDKRAKAAKDYLVSLGIPSARIDVISYGEEKPQCREHNEECWAKNRRDHFVIVKGRK